jgi:linoleate 10R-lipoxygenase
MKRFSSVFKKSRDDSKLNVNGAQPNSKRNSKAVAARAPEGDDNNAKRHEVSATFEEYAQLIHASRRPLPMQTGDGTYLDNEHNSSIFQDLGVLGVKDFGTLMDVIKNKVTGGLVDDKTMLMEHIIQVHPPFLTG